MLHSVGTNIFCTVARHHTDDAIFHHMQLCYELWCEKKEDFWQMGVAESPVYNELLRPQGLLLTGTV